MNYNKSTKFGFYLMTAIFLTLGLSISLQSLLAAWTPATDSPPNVNTDIPINEGPNPQTKLGDLVLGDDLSVEGRVQVDQSTANDLWIQGGALGTSGDPRNLAILGIKSTDQLRINYNGEYTGGVRIQSNLTIDGSIGGQEGFSVANDVIDVYDDATSNAPYSRVSADSLHSNGLGVGQIWIEGHAIDANQTIRIGKGLAGGQTVKDVEMGQNLTVAGTIKASDPIEDSHVATKGWVMANAGGGGISMLSAEVGYTNLEAAISSCWNLEQAAQYAPDGDTVTVYNDWRLPNIEELSLFMGLTSDTSYLWTTTNSTSDDYKVLELGDTYTSVADADNSNYFRCVR